MNGFLIKMCDPTKKGQKKLPKNTFPEKNNREPGEEITPFSGGTRMRQGVKIKLK